MRHVSRLASDVKGFLGTAKLIGLAAASVIPGVRNELRRRTREEELEVRLRMVLPPDDVGDHMAMVERLAGAGLRRSDVLAAAFAWAIRGRADRWLDHGEWLLVLDEESRRAMLYYFWALLLEGAPEPEGWR